MCCTCVLYLCTYLYTSLWVQAVTSSSLWLCTALLVLHALQNTPSSCTLALRRTVRLNRTEYRFGTSTVLFEREGESDIGEAGRVESAFQFKSILFPRLQEPSVLAANSFFHLSLNKVFKIPFHPIPYHIIHPISGSNQLVYKYPILVQ
jgi:hypothetical protein